MKIVYKGTSSIKVNFFYKNSTRIPQELKLNGFFEGKELQIFIKNEKDSSRILVGLGDKKEKDYFKLLKTGISAFNQALKNLKVSSVIIDFEQLDENLVFYIMQGMCLASFYTYTLKSKEDDKSKLKELIVHYQKNNHIIEKSKNIALSRNIVRGLVDKPANILNTKNFAQQIKQIFSKTDVNVEIWDDKKLKEENLQGIIAVGKGAEVPPHLVKLHYKPENALKKVILVGKGVVFDSGGLSLKPTDGMLDMKGDMGGAATVVGAIHAIQALNLPIEVYGLLPLAENLISATAYRVSDVIKYNNGKTVEVNNTDAEGRLILADALHLTKDIDATTVIDMATLTGACMVALGPDIYGAFSNNEKLLEQFTSFVNQKTSEKTWALPLLDKYKDQLKSKIADLKNTGKRWGGAITAALFLKEFVPKDKKWLHLDIAGPFFDEGIGLFDGMATGIPLESLVLFLEQAKL